MTKACTTKKCGVDAIVSGDHITQKKPASDVFLVTAWFLGIKPTSKNRC